MKKFFMTTFLIMFGLTLLMAHPASSINLSFDKTNATLKVDFQHKVSDEGSHFIYDVEVKLNGKKIAAQSMFKQDNKEGGYVIYRIVDAKAGDKISVMVDCNKGGKKTETIVIK